jgi:hypothetical protein
MLAPFPLHLLLFTVCSISWNTSQIFPCEIQIQSLVSIPFLDDFPSFLFASTSVILMVSYMSLAVVTAHMSSGLISKPFLGGYRIPLWLPTACKFN